MGHHEAYTSQKAYVRSLLTYCPVENEELFITNHFCINHRSKRLSAQDESNQMRQVLRWEVEYDSIDVAPCSAPHLRECVSYDNQHTIWRHHQNAATDVNQQKDEEELSRIVLVLLHEVLDLIRVENFHKAD